VTTEQIDRLLEMEEAARVRKHELQMARLKAGEVKAEHTSKLKELEFRQDGNQRAQDRWASWGFGAFVLVVAILLCWLFLHFDKPEYIIAVFTAIGGFAAGFGVGKATGGAPPQQTPTASEPPPQA